MNPAPMIVLAWLATDSGYEQVEMTAQRYAAEWLSLPKVVRGGNINDMDLILKRIYQFAEAEEDIERSRANEEEVQ